MFPDTPTHERPLQACFRDLGYAWAPVPLVKVTCLHGLGDIMSQIALAGRGVVPGGAGQPVGQHLVEHPPAGAFGPHQTALLEFLEPGDHPGAAGPDPLKQLCVAGVYRAELAEGFVQGPEPAGELSGWPPAAWPGW